MDAETCNQLAWEYLRAGESQLALEHALRAHELKRNNLDFLNTLGVAYGEAGQLDLAEAAFRKLLKRKPGYADALVNLAKALEKQERFEEAAKFLSRALAMAPSYPGLAANLAGVYLESGDIGRARAVLDAAANAIDGENHALMMAGCDLELGETGAAISRLEAALRGHPDWAVARMLLANTLLSTGNWSAGWKQYLWRSHAANPDAPAPASAPLGARLEGQRILLRGDQGIGDVLFFLRFAPLVRERGAGFALACEDKLRPILPADLMQTSGAFDREVMIGDLPALLGTEATPPAFALRVAEAEKRAAVQRLAALGPAPYLAVTWRAGSDVHRGREFGEQRKALMKAVPPALLGAVLRGWPGTLVLLQRGARPEDIPAFSAAFGAPAHDLSVLGDDLPALLGVLAVLDEYVCVSNANVHLLAGLGRVARVLVPRPPEWRWMRAGEASPWFPGFAIYRQPVSRDWSAPLARLRQDLVR